MKKSKLSLKRLSTVAALSLGLLLLCAPSLFGEKIRVTMAPPGLRDRLNYYAKVYGFSPDTVEFILGMSALETGLWTSKIYLYQHNPWGMKTAKVRPNSQTQSLSKPDGFAWYSGEDMAAKDIFQWLVYSKAPDFSTLTEFVKFLKSKSYFDSHITWQDYLGRIKRIIQ